MTVMRNRLRRTSGKPPAENAGHAGPVFTEFIEKELAYERDRRKSLDARGISALTTSSTLVTLIVGLGAIVTSVDGFEPGWPAIALLGFALLAFVLTALLGLLANRLVKYQVVDPAQLRTWRDHDKKWNDEADKAKRVIAEANITTIETLRKGNGRKAKLLEAALWSQLAAIVLLAAAVGVVLVGAVG